ncbi:MAG: sulfatase-like hydrolase/transferase, partial [Planctomycetia bacterium]|nr:sulfatase-like hydrolase/transferase [Planctomycetia bacterium]
YGGRYGPYRALGENRPLRGWKGGLYEGGVRVPAFANWPGTLTPRVVSATASALDWCPTLAGLAGARVDPRWRWEGTDLWPTLTGAAGPVSRRLYWKTGRESAVREGDLKLILPRRKGGVPELYDVAQDPGEAQDLAPRHPDRVSRLLKGLEGEQALDP